MRIIFFLLVLALPHQIKAQNTTLYQPIRKAALYDSLVLFQWKSVPNGIPYSLEISTDSTFSSSSIHNNIVNNTTSLSGLLYGQKYWWRVHTASGFISLQRNFEIIDKYTLPSPSIWLRADSAVSHVSNLVNAWNDLGDSVRNATQPLVNLRPEYKGDGPSQNPYVHFGKQGSAGQATYLSHPSIRFTAPNFTVITTYRLSSTSIILGYMLGGFQTGLFAGGSYQGGWGSGILDGTNAVRVAGQPSTDWGTLSYSYSQVWRNGISLPMTGVNVNQLKYSQLGTPTDLPATLFFHGDLAEIMIFPTTLADTTRKKFERYQMAKYARPIRLPYDTNVCAPSITLTLPGGMDEYSSITWSTGAATPSVNITANGIYWVRGTSRIGGYQTSDTIRVKGIFSKPQITPTTNQTFCFNRDTIVFKKLTNTPGVIYTWQNGSMDDSISVVSGSEVFLTAFDAPSGCFVSSDTITLTHKTKADFANQAVCPDVNVLLQDLSLDILGDTINAWSWNFGDPTTNTDVSSDTNGVWNYANSGTYPVYLKITTSDGCADSITKNLLVKPSATPNFNWQGLCYGKPTQFFDQSTPENGTQVTGYQWNFGPGINSSFVNPAVVFDTANTYPVSLKIFTASGCNETIIRQVPVNKGVNADFDLADSLCANQNINVLDQSQGVNDNIVSWAWRFGSNTPVSGQSPSFAFQNTGNRIVRLTTVTSAGCADSTQQNVFVRPAASANFSLAVNGGTPPFRPEVANLTVNAVSHTWYIDGLFFSNEFTPVLPSYADTGRHTIALVVENAQGCTSEMEKSFVIYTGDRTLQLIDATCTPNDGFMKYSARVFNKGALEVNEITFGANTDYNSVIQEVWTGSLLPGQVLDYQLKASSKYYTSADFCCVRIDAFNDSLKVQSPDNEICLPLTEQAWLSAAYPTPTNGMVTVDYIFPFADKFSATLCEIDGKVIKNLFTNQSVGAGFGSFTTDVSDVKAGVYVIRLAYRDRFFSVKMVKQ